MYCPKCNAPLEEDPKGWLRCTSGQLEFSVDLSRRLRATYGSATGRSLTTPDLSGRDFFCPGCGIAIPKGSEACSTCGVSLLPIMWHLSSILTETARGSASSCGAV
jgi:hypothetical protein